MDNSTLSQAYCKTISEHYKNYFTKKTATPKPDSISHQINNENKTALLLS